MFRIIPLGSVLRNGSHSIDNILIDSTSKFTSFNREILGPNTCGPIGTSNPISKKLFRIRHNQKESQFYQNRYEQNNLLMMQGMRTIELYCPDTSNTEFLEITPDNIYKNGKLYYGSPAILSWNGQLFHKTTSGAKGAISINFIEKGYTIQEIENPIPMENEEAIQINLP